MGRELELEPERGRAGGAGASGDEERGIYFGTGGGGGMGERGEFGGREAGFGESFA